MSKWDEESLNRLLAELELELTVNDTVQDLIKELKKGYFLVNVSTTDVGGDHNEVPTEENQNCHFGVYNDDMDEIENFYDPFIIGYEKILKKYN